MSKTYLKSLVFNSVFKNNTDISNPVYYLNNPIKNVLGYSLSNFVGPNTFYTISSRNNTFSFVETTSSGTVRTVTLLTGSYTSTTFATALATALTSAASSGTVTVIPNTTTYKFTITFAIASKIVAVPNNVYYEAGYNVLSTSYQTVIAADSTFDFSGVKSINLISSLVNGNKLVNSNASIIASIPVNVGFAGIINYQNNNEIISIPSQDLNNISFSFLDDRCRVLTVNNDFSITILFETES